MASNLRVDQITASTAGSVSIGTATFTGGLSGNITGLNVTGVITATTLNQNVSGILTAQNGIHVTGGSVGIGTVSPSSIAHIRQSLAGAQLTLDSAAGFGFNIRAINNTSNNTLGLYGTRAAGTGSSGIDVVIGSTNTRSSGRAIMQVQNNGTSLLRVDAGGDVQISNGNLVFSTSGTGIDFSATANGSGTTTSELLDDYEEGTWTPTTTQFAEYTSNGRYTKIGRIVYIEGVISRNTTTTPNAVNLQAQSLPFTVNNISAVVSGNYWLDEGGPSTNQGDSVGSVYFLGSSTTVLFLRPTDPSNQSSARYVQADEVTNGRGVSFYGWYRV